MKYEGVFQGIVEFLMDVMEIGCYLVVDLWFGCYFFGGLFGKLFVLIIVFVMIVEVFIYVLFIVNFWNIWLIDWLMMVGVVVFVLVEINMIVLCFQEELLKMIGVVVIVFDQGLCCSLIVMSNVLRDVDFVVDMGVVIFWFFICDSFFIFIYFGDGLICVVVCGQMGYIEWVDIVFLVDLFCQDMLVFFGCILVLFLLILGIIVVLVYIMLWVVFIWFLWWLIWLMEQFVEYLEDVIWIIEVFECWDELGDVEICLVDMEWVLLWVLYQKQCFVDLGFVVLKINYDLRNFLVFVQLFIECLEYVFDLIVNCFVFKILVIFDCVVGYIQVVMVYGKVQESFLQCCFIVLNCVVDDVVDVLGLFDYEVV